LLQHEQLATDAHAASLPNRNSRFGMETVSHKDVKICRDSQKGR
jgi:hypothetical protein